MIYQRHIPREELLSAQLEMLLQNGRVSVVYANAIGIIATVFLFWGYLPLTSLLLWASLFFILLLMRSLHMSNALVERRFSSSPVAVYWQLLLSASLTGGIWALIYIYASRDVPVGLQYLFLLVVVTITVMSMSSVQIREYYLATVFSSLLPIAWWSLSNYWSQGDSLIIGLMLLGYCALLMAISNRIYLSFQTMISMNWEREVMSQELADLAGSLRDRNRQLQDARRQLTDLANVDELTGLGNRRLVNSTLQEEINRARRSGTDLGVILLDVDYFKNYNDHYGHPAGDQVLQQLSDLMQRATSRAGEVVARYGGEEFILILPGASSEVALRTAEHLRELIIKEKIPHESSELGDFITVSQGVFSLVPEGGVSPSEVIHRADQALYRAKDAGRNRVELAAAA
ncbi:MAG: diguanylate cyclase [Pseudomonadota bacterium]